VDAFGIAAGAAASALLSSSIARASERAPRSAARSEAVVVFSWRADVLPTDRCFSACRSVP
jgi:hypothetical protein